MSSFLEELQTQLAESHRSQVAEMVAYPLLTEINDKKVEVRSKDEFLRLYDQIFTEPLKKLLLEQRPACIGRMGAQGFTISNGEVWFGIYPDGSVKMFTITPVVMPDEH